MDSHPLSGPPPGASAGPGHDTDHDTDHVTDHDRSQRIKTEPEARTSQGEVRDAPGGNQGKPEREAERPGGGNGEKQGRSDSGPPADREEGDGVRGKVRQPTCGEPSCSGPRCGTLSAGPLYDPWGRPAEVCGRSVREVTLVHRAEKGNQPISRRVDTISKQYQDDSAGGGAPWES
ncbi:hypothetical protein SLA_3650 [Streptomyces laurentii]|uniref:Uncharacterized protein n=1 Tax=Streptomyces laurentii TaxID=39478 RepID=A0A160NZV4_STRLU|nr:hypothetical protein SLA_3650 [Streptomyces laurentii]